MRWLLLLALAACGGAPHPAVVDSDHDGIADADDKCPQEPETKNGFDDRDGCPDTVRLTVNVTEPGIDAKVFFRENSAEIAGVQMPLIQDIADVVRSQSLAKLEIRGYADRDEVDPEHISERRALAVGDALVMRGVDRTIIVTKGYGAGLLLDDDRAQPAAHRRVDFATTPAAP